MSCPGASVKVSRRGTNPCFCLPFLAGNAGCTTARDIVPANHRPSPEGHCMDIRFVSSLTPEDENQLAPAVLRACTALLDLLPIAYTLRIETCETKVFQHTHPSPAEPIARLPGEFSV